jgi:hypothetical protein
MEPSRWFGINQWPFKLRDQSDLTGAREMPKRKGLNMVMEQSTISWSSSSEAKF